MKRFYLDIPDLLQTVAVVVKLEQKLHRRCVLSMLLRLFSKKDKKNSRHLQICQDQLNFQNCLINSQNQYQK